MTRPLGVLFLVCAFAVRATAAPQTDKGTPVPKDKHSAAILALIDQLVTVSDQDIGFSASVTGTVFLPLEAQGQVHGLLLFEPPPTPSDAMRKLVKHGALALPHLLNHLKDTRKTAVQVRLKGRFQLLLAEELDPNWRTDRLPRAEPRQVDAERHEDAYTVTVGDLCFVAIGQIVNREYNAVRYQPTGIVVVNSPTRSPYLHNAVKQSWQALTQERHRAHLIADAVNPDSDQRRVGALKRLAYYYPDALEPLALKLLARPGYSAADVAAFVRGRLYREADPKKCRALWDGYVAKHGEASRDGILCQLFADLRVLESRRRLVLPPPRALGDHPRRLLVQLYGWPRTVTSRDSPRLEPLSAGEKAVLIGEGLIYDRSEKLDRAVRELLASSKDDDYLAQACVERLLGRGYDADIEAYCRRRLAQLTDDHDTKPIREIQGKLGWTRLHVAAERNDLNGVQALLHDQAPVNATGRSGQTPLHVAAAEGYADIARLLLRRGATVDAVDARGLTPLDLARQAGHANVVRLLRSQTQKGERGGP